MSLIDINCPEAPPLYLKNLDIEDTIILLKQRLELSIIVKNQHEEWNQTPCKADKDTIGRDKHYFNMKDFKKYYVIPAPPEEVYLALTLSATIQLWTGDKVEMEAVPGTEFSLWDGSIVGKNLEFETSKKIVQQWYFGDGDEDSIVTIKLHPDAHGTSIELKHTNIPDDAYADIVDGWNTVYFGSLHEFYE